MVDQEAGAWDQGAKHLGMLEEVAGEQERLLGSGVLRGLHDSSLLWFSDTARAISWLPVTFRAMTHTAGRLRQMAPQRTIEAPPAASRSDAYPVNNKHLHALA